MLDRDTIEADLRRDDAEDLRDTFDALVAWDGAGRMAGVTRADEIMALFERVCGALRDDEGRLPPDTLRALLRGRGGPTGPVDTYGGAARFALAMRRTWWTAFSAGLPGEA